MTLNDKQAAPVAQGMTLAEAKELLGLPETPHRLRLASGATVLGSRDAIEEVKALAQSAVTEPLQGTQEPAAITDEQVNAALGAWNDFPCPKNKSICRGWNDDQMRAALTAAFLAVPAPSASPAALTDEQILNAVGEAHILALQGKSWKEAAQPIRALLAAQPPAAAEADKRDVERYRWLRDKSGAKDAVEGFWGGCTKIVEISDEAIDAAMSASKEE